MRRILAVIGAGVLGFMVLSAGAAEWPCRAYVNWKRPAAPQQGTAQYDAVAAAYAFRTPDRAAVFSNGWRFVEAVYGRDYEKGAPPGIIVETYDAEKDPEGCGAAMQRLMDALEPGDVVAVRGTNGVEEASFYAGDVYGDRQHGCLLYPHVHGRFIIEHTVATLVNWPVKGAMKLRVAKAFRLLRPLKDPAARIAERRAFPAGVTTKSGDERLQAVLSLVWARFLKGPAIQYDSKQIVSEAVRKRTAPAKWWRNDYRRPVSEVTADHTGFTVCSVMPYEVYWELFGYGLGDDMKGVQSFNLTRYPAKDILVYKYDRKENRKPPEQVLKEAWDALEPGDVISYANVYCKRPGGHVMVCVGEVDGIKTMLHSGGQKFEFGKWYDQLEYDGTMLKDDAYGYLFAPGKEGKIENAALLKRDQFVILRPLKRADLALTPSGKAWAKLPKFRYDRRVKGGLYGSVVSGEELPYGVELFNASQETCEAPVVETLPQGTELVTASEGCVVEGRRLSWPVTLRPGERRVVSWVVKVTAKPGGQIVSGGGSAGGIASNTLTTEVVSRKVSADEAFAWAAERLRGDLPLPACRVRGWEGGHESAAPPKEERVHETRSRDLMTGDVVLSTGRRGSEEFRRIWVKDRGGMVERKAEGKTVPVPEDEVTHLMCCDYFCAFRPAAE